MLQAMSYFGSKGGAGVYQAIIAAMPPHDVYIETHLGSGAVMLKKPPAARSIGVDLDAGVIDRFDYPGVETITLDALAVIDNFDYAGSRRVLIYSDPPYLHHTRTSRRRYKFEYTRQDHIELIRALREAVAAGAMAMISGYPSELYDQLLSDWRSIEFQAMTRGGVRTEKLWLSFPAGLVHWSSYAGKNFTDRQRIKRKAARWKSNYRKLPEAERLSILAAMLET